MIIGPPLLAMALYAAQAAPATPEKPPQPSPTLGTSAAIWCPARGLCSTGVAISIGDWKSVFGHGRGKLYALLGSHSSGLALAHGFPSGPHLTVAVGLGAVVPYDQPSGLRGAQGVLLGVLETR